MPLVSSYVISRAPTVHGSRGQGLNPSRSLALLAYGLAEPRSRSTRRERRLPSVFEIPAELVLLGLRIAIIIALYGFLFIVIREIRKDWKRSTVTRSSSFGLVVSTSQSDKVEVGQVFELDDRNSIGRLQSSAIRLDDEHISARHAEVFRGTNGTWLLRDAGSTNGTRLNGEPVSGQVQVKSGDLIDLGTVTFRFDEIDR
jgi:hypothetical protein